MIHPNSLLVPLVVIAQAATGPPVASVSKIFLEYADMHIRLLREVPGTREKKIFNRTQRLHASGVGPNGNHPIDEKKNVKNAGFRLEFKDCTLEHFDENPNNFRSLDLRAPRIPLPLGIKLGDSRNDIIRKVGMPIPVSEEDLSYLLPFEGNGSFSLDFHFQDNKLSSIRWVKL